MIFSKYRQATQVIVAILSTIFVFIMVIVYPRVVGPTGSSTSLIVFVLCSSSAYSIFYLLCLWLYEKVGWKLIHRRDNYSGCWDMIVTYEFLERPAKGGLDRLPLPYNFHSVFKIDQTALTLRFPAGYSAPNEVWKDRCTRITPDGIDMSYEVTRSDKALEDTLPPQAFGFEMVRVTEYDKYGRPSMMSGTMYHAALPDINLYRGRTRYTRIPSKRYDEILAQLISEEAD